MPLSFDGRLDVHGLEEVFARERPAAYLRCSQRNPTGVVHTPVELRAVAEGAERNGVRVVVDEIHAPLVHPGVRFTPHLSVAGGSDGFVLNSASKGWNLAGLKAAVLAAGFVAAADLARLTEAALLLENARAAVTAGGDIRSRRAGRVRLNFATSRAVLDDAVGRMGAAVAK